LNNTLVIGVAGGSGSGKTTLVRKILSDFEGKVTAVYHDNYYKCNDHLSYEERVTLNYDHPDAYDTDLMIEHLKKLKNGEAIDCPVYDFTKHNRSKETIHIVPKSIIVIEGILIFENEALRNMMDIRVFVDADADVRILRRMIRDVKKRGRDLNSVANQYLSTVKPMHEMYVEPSKQYADIIVPQGGKNMVAQALINARINEFLSSGR